MVGNYVKRAIWGSALLCMLGAACSANAARPAQEMDDTEMGISTGSLTGTYIAFGKDIARVAAKEGLVIHVYPSNGSIENITRITSKQKVGLAIVQSDVLGFLSHSQNPDSVETAKKLRLVAPFYSEEVHILARKDISSINDLQGKRVVVGSEGSGSMITAVNIFSLLGITPAKLYQIDPPQGAVAVLNNDADAMVFVGGKPVKMFKNMEALENIAQGANAGKINQVHFLPLTDPRLLKEYKAATITSNDYNYAGNVATIAVTALLVSYDYTMKNEAYYHEQCHNMATLAHALRDHLPELQESGHPKWREVNLQADVIGWKRDACSEGVFALPDTAAPKGSLGLEKDLLSIVRGQPN